MRSKELHYNLNDGVSGEILINSEYSKWSSGEIPTGYLVPTKWEEIKQRPQVVENILTLELFRSFSPIRPDAIVNNIKG